MSSAVWDPVERARNLEKADAKRLRGAAVRRKVVVGTLSAAEALYHPDAGVLTVGALLRSQRRWGPKRVWRFLEDLTLGVYGRRHYISENRRVEALTEREKRQLADALS